MGLKSTYNSNEENYGLSAVVDVLEWAILTCIRMFKTEYVLSVLDQDL